MAAMASSRSQMSRGVVLAVLGRRAVEGGVLADGSGDGLFGEGVDIEGHDVLPEHWLNRSGVAPDVTVFWDTLAQGSHRVRNDWPGPVREWCGRRERSD